MHDPILFLQLCGSALSQSKKSNQGTDDDDDDDHPNTIVLANKSDKFTFDQVR